MSSLQKRLELNALAVPWIVLHLMAGCTPSSVEPREQPADAGAIPAPSEPDSGMPAEDAGAREEDAGAMLPPDAGVVESVACGMALEGPPLGKSFTEAKTSYAEYVAQLDALTLPAIFDFSRESKLQRALVQYLLRRKPGATAIPRAEVEALGPMGKALLGAAAKSKIEKEIDVPFLRLGLYAFYACTVKTPPTLASFKARFGDYKTWRIEDLACGRPKNSPRRFYENDDLGIYVAETLVEGEVRETEVLFTNLRGDGQLDFAVYTEKGTLTDRSPIAAFGGAQIVSAAPFACMGCHYNEERGRFDELRPANTGAGCRVRDAGVVDDAGVDAGVSVDGGTAEDAGP
jgi:hypothetical protein